MGACDWCGGTISHQVRLQVLNRAQNQLFVALENTLEWGCFKDLVSKFVWLARLLLWVIPLAFHAGATEAGSVVMTGPAQVSVLANRTIEGADRQFVTVAAPRGN